MLDHIIDGGRVPLRLEDDTGGQRSAIIDVGDDATRLTEPGMLFDGLGFKPWQPPAIVGEVASGGAAEAAGVQTGDRIVQIDGEPISSFSDLRGVVSLRPDKAVTIEVERGADTLQMNAVIGSDIRDEQRVGLLGVGAAANTSDYFYLRKFGPLDSIGHATTRMWSSTMFTLRMLGRMVTGDVSIKNISGPINIAQFAGASAQAGISNFLGFLAIVSISLGVLNLLPVPVLDGGQIVYQLVEWIKGSPMSERAQLAGQQAGILALLLLMSFAFYNDIARMLA